VCRIKFKDQRSADLAAKGVGTVKKQEVRDRIEKVGIIPTIRMSSAEDVCFAAETVNCAGHRQ
jgi:hypothetical protein